MILEKRLQDFGGDPKKAFVNLDENPIWLNKERGISIKNVTITGVSNAVALHDKKDKFGNLILDKEGKTQPVDFVNTSNNQHVAIYRDSDGNLQENVISFFEASARVNAGLPIIDKSFKRADGWEFLFSIKQNEYFVFPNSQTGFDPQELDLKDDKNFHLVSPNLFRVQKIGSKDYVFRHHLETQLNDLSELEGVVFHRLRSTSRLSKLQKVRINHLGEIVEVGEY
jgi:CRISPR-associated endonuclease Csn1